MTAFKMTSTDKAIAISLLVIAISFRFLPDNFLLMLAKSFALQVLVLFTIVTTLLLLFKRWIAAVSGLLSIALIYSLISVPLVGNSGLDPMKTSGIRIAHFNVLMFTSKHQSTIDKAKEIDADLISFQEVDYRWENSLKEGLSEQYPYYKIIVRKDPYGIAVFSKHPLENVRVLHFGNMPNISGDVKINGQPIHFVTSHTRAPMRPVDYNRRNRHIKSVARYLNKIKGPKLAIGDYNSVPWDDQIVRFKKDSDMRDSRKSLAATYPSHYAIARIPLDYIFHSKELVCKGFKTVNGTASDHFGVVGVYRFKGQQKTKKNDQTTASQF
jgi:endonuclease/exonuclease/phosphatase (EEP) superfamily protein YafD